MSGHDISDGGLITTLLEMCFAGVHGTSVNLTSPTTCPIHVLFAEEIGWLLEVPRDQENEVKDAFMAADVPVLCIGSTGNSGMNSRTVVRVNGNVVLDKPLHELFCLWEETSFQLELLQTSPACAREEFNGLRLRTGASYKLSFDPDTYLQLPPISSRKIIFLLQNTNFSIVFLQHPV